MKRSSLLSFRSQSSRFDSVSSISRRSFGDTVVGGSRIVFMSPSSIHHIRSEHVAPDDVNNVGGNELTEHCTCCVSCRDPAEDGADARRRSTTRSGICCTSCCHWNGSFIASSIFDQLATDLIVKTTASLTVTSSSSGVQVPASVTLLGRELKIQAVENDGCWFALDSAKLELCRRLERRGLCRQVRVEVIPSRDVPPRLRTLMTRPVRCCRADRMTSSSTAAAPDAGAVVAAGAVGPSVVTRMDVSQLASQHCDKFVSGLLPHAVAPAVVMTTDNSVPPLVLGIGLSTASGHVTKGYRKLEQDDNEESTASESDEEAEESPPDSDDEEQEIDEETPDSDDEEKEIDGESDEFDSDCDVSAEELDEDDMDDNDDIISYTGSVADGDWMNDSENCHGVLGSEGIPSDDEKNCLI